jgi:hypothetical protein
MLAVVWRVSSPDFDVDEFIDTFGLLPGAVWRQGQPRRPGAPPATASGFNLSVDQEEHEDSFEGVLQDLWAFLEEERAAFDALRARGIPSTIDIGFTVGSTKHFMRSVWFTPADLARLAEVGLTLEISAYPCSDE